MSKSKLIKECRMLMLLESDEGGMSDHDEFNNIVTDLLPRLLPHLNTVGLKLIKDEFEGYKEDVVVRSQNRIEYIVSTPNPKKRTSYFGEPLIRADEPTHKTED